MIQTESQRQFYLGSAGVRMWYARAPLPGAAPSPEFVFPEPDEVVQHPAGGPRLAPVENARVRVPTDRSTANKKGVQRIASLQALMESKAVPTAQQPNPPKQSQSEVSDPSPEHSSETAEPYPDIGLSAVEALSLGVFYGSRCLLIADISQEASLSLQETLATNILKSLGDEKLEPVAWVRWPVFKNRVVPGNSLSDLKAVMQHVLRDMDDRKVIVLGGDEGIDEADPTAGWLYSALGRAPEVKSTHSLAALASNPGLKRSLWELLKPLAQK
ncbi:2-isopropylmalate synthase [Marinobacter xiaoshiensis]|uniref:2-isopropylmalate synthase n=1 Tax=Marinobacter xiaoshiensis TaxID=3073652 RepID=A0ABU2HNR6_9GAMM|nr:2-isopropylmalate synthase [Marinobacter sp. F60267]MDS1311970.1 2-isopropylmalate synthase [Marinobacter sp. F60267]